MRQTFEVPGALDGLNEYTAACNSHYHAGAKMKRANQDVVAWAARGLRPMKGPVSVRITWVEGIRPGRKKFVPRDRDNIRFAAKFVLDALKEIGVIEDDAWGKVVSITDEFRLNRNNPRIIVELEEA